MIKTHRRRKLLVSALSGFCVLTMAALLFVVLFEPGLAYRTVAPVPPAQEAALTSALAQAVGEAVVRPSDTALFADGERFYPAELEAIRGATRSIELEAFIFHKTPIGERFLSELAARARAGVKVRVVVDAVGSLPTPDGFFDRLRAAGGTVVWYQPFRWYTLKHWNNRTHRELLIVDGDTAFIGGAGIGSAWDAGTPKLPPWRDLMVRVRGAPARELQSVFFQGWLEASGEILVNAAPARVADQAHAVIDPQADAQALIVGSNPTGGRATHARVMYQLMVDAARSEIVIDSPYFVPDRSMRRALLRAVARGVRVTVLTPGRHNNHPIARIASRRHYGELIAGGVRIYEYRPGMIHTKLFLADGLWTIVGSTNFDNRSLGLNNEVNMALRDAAFAREMHGLLDGYLAQSERITLESWAARPWFERFLAGIGSVLERQE
jgi:cardiolipin synthase